VSWHGAVPEPIRALTWHLPPARDDPDARRRWRYGLLTWRRGPGIAVVEDGRALTDRTQLTLDLPALATAFGADLNRATAATAIEPRTLAELAAARLVCEVNGSVVWLPYRLRRWPVAPPE
jgi:hypothetical protein